MASEIYKNTANFAGFFTIQLMTMEKKDQLEVNKYYKVNKTIVLLVTFKRYLIIDNC